MLKYNAKYIEKIFYQYENIKQAVNEARQDSEAGKTGGNSSWTTFVNDPTANMAMKEVMPLHSVVINLSKFDIMTIKEPEKWIRVIEYTYKNFDKKLLVML